MSDILRIIGIKYLEWSFYYMGPGGFTGGIRKIILNEGLAYWNHMFDAAERLYV